MEQTKADVVASGNVTHQEALVKQLIQRKTGPMKHLIPGGATLLDNLDERLLETAVYTWLKRSHKFNGVTINMVKDPSAREGTETKVEEFADDIMPPWERVEKGKRWLSKVVARHLGNTKLISIRVTREGVWIKTPSSKEKLEQTSEDWEPHLLFDVKGKDEYSVF